MQQKEAKRGEGEEEKVKRSKNKCTKDVSCYSYASLIRRDQVGSSKQKYYQNHGITANAGGSPLITQNSFYIIMFFF